jgi:hypothetical protein
MDEATRTITPQPRAVIATATSQAQRQTMGRAVMVLAQRSAIKATKQRLQGVGLKPRAQARGVRFGRKLKLTKHQRQEAIARREAVEALVDIGRSYNVSHSTISRLASVGA